MISLKVLALALIVGAANWAFRVLPVLMGRSRGPGGGRLARFLGATGPAAIATLFVASVLPLVGAGPSLPLVAGIAAVGGVFATTRSVVGATLAGAVAFGLVTALVPG